MSDKKLQTLFSQLTAVMIAHGYSDKPWNTDVKQIVAGETGFEVSNYFDASDADYLSLHTKAELGELAGDVGIALDVTAMKKTAAVTYLSENEQIKAYRTGADATKRLKRLHVETGHHFGEMPCFQTVI